MGKLILVVPLALLLALAGCGNSSAKGGGTVTGETTATVTKKDFVKKGNAICARYESAKERQLEAAYKQGESLTSARAEELITAIVIPLAAKMNKELGEVGLPVKERAKAEKVITEFQKGVKRAKADPGSAVDGTAFKRADETAAAYGMTSCVL